MLAGAHLREITLERQRQASQMPTSGKSAMLLALRDMGETSLLGIPI